MFVWIFLIESRGAGHRAGRHNDPDHAAGGPVVVVGYLQVERVCKVEHELERLLSIEVLCKNVEWLTRHLAAALVDTEEARGEHSFRGVFEQLLEG